MTGPPRRTPWRQATLVLAVAIAAALAAQAQPGSPGEPTDVPSSKCYECHAQGGGGLGPPMRQVVAIVPPENVSTPVGETVDYAVIIANAWTAEILDIAVAIDISGAPSLGFASDVPPVKDDRETVVLATEATTTERTVRTKAEVPPTATDVRLRAVPQQQQALLAPDVILRLWAPSADPSGEPTASVDDAGPGGTETYHVKGGREIASLGTGNWTVEVAQSVPTALLAGLIEQSVDVVRDVWSNTTGERIQFRTVEGSLDGQRPASAQQATVRWTLLAESEPGAAERIQLTANVTAFYRHPPSITPVNEWRFTTSVGVPVQGANGTEVPQVDFPTGGGPVAQEPPAVALPWDRIGEIVGYVSAFLLVLSMATGGVFGKASRRGLNKVFRSAKRRVAFHNFVSYFLTGFAAVHTVMFILEPGFPWTLGLLWGGVALVAMLLLGVTGAIQLALVRRWGYAGWRWTHLLLAIAAIVFTAVHMLLDGANFTDVADAVGWRDPFQ